MRLSCNGCRVLRKGCSDACTIRPCLQWIKSPDAQANATVFLAKFYGRAGLLNLIAAAPTDALRPAVFRSLLYEACGRIVNPVYGAVGLLWSGTWHMCQAAVEAVLKGAPIVQVSPDDAAGPPIHAAAAAAAAAAYDIRHVFPKSSSSNKQSAAAAAAGAPPAAAVDDAAAAAQSQVDDKDKHTDRGKVSKPKFKRSSSSSSPSKTKKSKTTTQNKKPHLVASPATEHHNDDDMLVADHSDEEVHHAAVRQASNSNAKSRRASSDDCDRHSASASLDTHDTEEAASHVSQAVAEPQQDDQQAEAEQQPPSMGLDLTLGLVTSSAPPHIAPATPAGCRQGGGSSAAVDEPAGVIGFRFL